MPLFSIVVPTRNRAHLLALALRSALKQTHDDYEIVVSDNDSADETEALVSRLGSEKLRYARTPRALSMPDNWEFALEQAKGEYVTFLCDDDAISPTLLGKVASLVQRQRLPLVMWGGASYYDESWHDPGLRNTLVVPTFTGRVMEMDSDGTLREVYGLRGGRLPMVVNSAFHRSLVDAVRKKAGRFFVGISPDFASGVAALSQLPTYTFMDQILSIGGGTSESVGMTGRRNRGEVFKRFIGEFGGQALRKRVPLKIDVQTPYLTEMFLVLKETFHEGLADYDIDWAQFFVNCYRELDIHEYNGVDVGADRAEFNRALSLQSAVVQARVRSLLSVEPSPSDSTVRRLSCASLGVHNIVECAEYIDRCPRTWRGVTKGLLVSMLGGSRGFRIARELGQTLNRLAAR
jgi:glycosyltransferase involved in cell wall biosynthesis